MKHALFLSAILLCGLPVAAAETETAKAAKQPNIVILYADVPDTAGEDSFSLLPLLKGEDKPIREHAVSCSSGGVPALRRGAWKYIAAPGSGGGSRDGDPTQPVQLYNLADDLGETKNLAAARPKKVAEMKALLEELVAAGRSTPGQPQPNDVEVVRHPKNSAPGKKAGAEPGS